jgi:hypothetical protein
MLSRRLPEVAQAAHPRENAPCARRSRSNAAVHIVRFYGTTHIGTAFGLLHYTYFHYFTIWCRSGPHKNRPVLGSRTYICILGRSRVRERGEGRGGGSR